ncbi:hypothetical protein BH23ACT9_BH23ACT9_39160 [soil metagenome]
MAGDYNRAGPQWRRTNGSNVDVNRQFPWRGFIPSGRVPLAEPEAQAVAADIHGEFIRAAAWIMLSSGQFDLGQTATMITQCRSTGRRSQPSTGR